MHEFEVRHNKLLKMVFPSTHLLLLCCKNVCPVDFPQCILSMTFWAWILIWCQKCEDEFFYNYFKWHNGRGYYGHNKHDYYGHILFSLHYFFISSHIPFLTAKNIFEEIFIAFLFPNQSIMTKNEKPNHRICHAIAEFCKITIISKQLIGQVNVFFMWLKIMYLYIYTLNCGHVK